MNITWVEGGAWSFDDVPGIISTLALGYAIEIQPVRHCHASAPLSFNVLYRQATMTESQVIALGCLTGTAARLTAERWLASELAQVQPCGSSSSSREK